MNVQCTQIVVHLVKLYQHYFINFNFRVLKTELTPKVFHVIL